MGKHTGKSQKKYNPQQILVYNELAKKHKCTYDFVKKAVRGDRKSEAAETIKKEFLKMMEQVKQVIS